MIQALVSATTSTRILKNQRATFVKTALSYLFVSAIAFLCAICSAPSVSAQSLGPPAIILPDGSYWTFSYTDLDGFGNPLTDHYTSPSANTSPNYYNNVSVDGTDGFGYSSALGDFGWSGNSSYEYPSDGSGGAWAGSFASGSSFILGVPAGVIITSTSTSTFTIAPPYGNSLSNVVPGYSYTVPSVKIGSQWVAKFFPSSSWPVYFQVNASPWYWYDADPNNDVSFSDAGPPTIFKGVPPPQNIYINGDTYILNSTTPTPFGGIYSDTLYYEDTNGVDYVQIGRTEESGGGYYYGDITGTAASGTESFWARFDPETWQIGTIYGDPVTVTVGPAGMRPYYGPPAMSWNGNILQCYGQTADGLRDIYWAMAPDGTDYTVIVGGFAAGYSALAVHGGDTFTGTYGASTQYTFNLSGSSSIPDLFSVDAYGNPLGLPAIGIVLLFASSDPGQSLLGSDGTVHRPTYYYRRTDGSWGLQYLGIVDGPFLVADENGSYSSPIYAYASAGGQLTRNGTTGWAQSNLYPPHLYVNGVICNLDPNSPYDSGGGLPRNGGASYHAGSSDLTVVLSWSWNTQFQGTVTGTFGQSSSFTGGWDGLVSFSNVSSGVVISLTPPSGGPSYGPPQVTVNGVVYTFNTSIGSGANNSYHEDVYNSSLGGQLTIDSNGNVSLGLPNGSSVTGTYNANTQQFSFQAGNTNVVLATDTAGHNLSAAAAGTSGEGTTELAGSLDIHGNALTLGSWSDNGASTNGFALLYSDLPGGASPSLLSLSSTRAQIQWNWNHPSTDAGNTQVTAMTLDAAHRVLLYDPNNPGVIGITLDPSGSGSVFNGPIRIQPHGDISMGQYQNSPVIP
jgi:hypothetical protein